MTNTVKPGKTALSGQEATLIVEGLHALARENQRMSEDAARLGFRPQAQDLARRAQDARALAGLAGSVTITKITVQHS